jgi:hypothetical protein
LRNHGDAKFPNLRTERVFVDENPPSHEQGTERPGRISKGSRTGGNSRSITSFAWSLQPWKGLSGPAK